MNWGTLVLRTDDKLPAPKGRGHRGRPSSRPFRPCFSGLKSPPRPRRRGLGFEKSRRAFGVEKGRSVPWAWSRALRKAGVPLGVVSALKPSGCTHIRLIPTARLHSPTRTVRLFPRLTPRPGCTHLHCQDTPIVGCSLKLRLPWLEAILVWLRQARPP